MPKPIYSTEEMREATFAKIRAEFEKEYKAQYDNATKKKMANGTFKFSIGCPYFWADDDSRATLRITPQAYGKMLCMIFGTDKEVGWHGIIKRAEEGKPSFVLEDVILYPQTVTAATIDADSEKYPMWAMSLPDEQFNHLRFHGHSHVNMGVTPSGTDLNFREDLLGQFKDGFYVFMIMNKKFERSFQIYDMENNNLFESDEVDVYIGDGDTENYETEVTASAKEMVVSRGYQYNNYGGGYYGSGYRGGNNGGKTANFPAAVSQKGASDFRDHTGFDDDYWRQYQ